MALTPAAKVGLVSLGALAVSGAGLVWLTNFSFSPQGYPLEVVYADVAGLMPDAPVMLMGVKIGKVASVVPEERQVRVRLNITDERVKVVSGSRFMIMSQGVIGEKSLEIFPPRGEANLGAAPLTPGSVVRGNDPQRLEFVMEELAETFNEFKSATDPKKLQELFSKTAANLYETSETVKRLGIGGEALLGDLSHTLAGVDRLVADTNTLIGRSNTLLAAADPEAVRTVVADIRTLTGGLRDTYQALFANPESRRKNAEALENLRSVAAELNKLAVAVNNVTGDPSLQRDLKDVVKNLNQLTQTVSGATSLTTQQAKSLSGFTVSPRLQGVAAQTPSGAGLAGNLGLRVDFASNYYQLGVEQIGEGNFLDLVFGSDRLWGDAGYHFGLIRSKIGVGMDYALTPAVTLTGQLYDPFRPNFRLGMTLFPMLDNQYGLMAQWARPVQTNENYFWMGVEWRPLHVATPAPEPR